MSPKPNPLRALPSVDALLNHAALEPALRTLPRAIVLEAVRGELALERDRLRGKGAAPADAETIARRAALAAEASSRPQIRRVLNATGIVLHTNLGRAPLSAAARRAISEVGSGYSNLEFDLSTGRRGGRGEGVERWLCRLTGAESAMTVNNGAAALVLALTATAAGGEVVVSRGELIEIGGSFRIPEILARSGARLHEVGTTNRTHLRDYERAFSSGRNIAALLRVHPSNFRISGFTARPSLEELAALAKRRRVPLIEDLGSGALVDLESFGLEREPTVRESLNAGCDLVTFSGDKLMGATQAGLILGRKRWVERARRDPLARALRVDKLTLAALESTLALYADPVRAVNEVPALTMLLAPLEALETRARRLAETLEGAVPGLEARVERGAGEVGGGALPLERLPGWVVSISIAGRDANEIEKLARESEPPVIGYIRSGRLQLNVRTLTDEESAEAAQALGRAWMKRGTGA